MMAASLMKACFKQCSSGKYLIKIVNNHQLQSKNVFIRKSIECYCFHTSAIHFKRRKTREEKKKGIQHIPKPKVVLPVVDIWRNMTVEELSESCNRSVQDVLQALAYVDPRKYLKSSVIEDRNVLFSAMKRLGVRYKIVSHPDKNEEDNEDEDKDVYKRPPPDPSITIKRHPVVTVMGHVDHGKTTLLDSLRHTSVVDSEFGGITQHIGAFNVKLESGEEITFLDTPGHAAFSTMRARGANVTDIVVLVVAADDGVMEQTIQSIRMAREAKVPIIVAINKIDKPSANISRTQKMLAEQGIIVEDLGGEIPCVNISALKSTNLTELVETIAAQAEIMNLCGDPTGPVEGVVVEVTNEVGRGKLATVLIQRGTLRKGCILVSGLAWAKVRAMFDHSGKPVSQATLSEAVEVIGWREMPLSGDEIIEVENERKANVVLAYRKAQASKAKALESYEVIQKKQEEHDKVYKEQLKLKRALGKSRRVKKEPRKKETEEGDGLPRFHVIIKADVLGSVEAILDVFDTYADEDRCHLDVVSYGIGTITENDIEIAQAFNAIIYTFNINTPKKIQELAQQLKVPIHNHKIIYKLIDDIKSEICKKLPPEEVEDKLGQANVLQMFEITERRKKVNVVGCRCTDGLLRKDGRYRILRQDQVIYEGKLTTMKHLKNDVNSIKSGVECGLKFDDPSIVAQQGDTIICYTTHQVPPKVHWDPGF